MALSANEYESGGFVRDPDHRLVTVPSGGTAGSGAAGYPNGAIPFTATSGDVANTATAATLTGVAGMTTYLTGFQVTGIGATASSVIAVSVTGTISGTLTYRIVIPVTPASIIPLIVSFPFPIPASATGTNITVNIAAFGAGSTDAQVSAQGFKL